MTTRNLSRAPAERDLDGIVGGLGVPGRNSRRLVGPGLGSTAPLTRQARINFPDEPSNRPWGSPGSTKDRAFTAIATRRGDCRRHGRCAGKGGERRITLGFKTKSTKGACFRGWLLL